MKATELLEFLLILLFTLTKQTTTYQIACPPWFIPDNRSTTGCSCYDSHPAVRCGSDFPLLRLGYCMTYNTSAESTEYGPCPYITRYNTTTIADHIHIQLPSNVSLLNEFMCGPLDTQVQVHEQS